MAEASWLTFPQSTMQMKSLTKGMTDGEIATAWKDYLATPNVTKVIGSTGEVRVMVDQGDRQEVRLKLVKKTNLTKKKTKKTRRVEVQPHQVVQPQGELNDPENPMEDDNENGTQQLLMEDPTNLPETSVPEID